MDFNMILDLLHYKVNKCLRKNCVKSFRCYYYHSTQDKRRKNYNKYEPKKCPHIKNCYKGINCPYSHNTSELLYHPKKYKKQLCSNFFKNNNCKYDKFCCNAHSEKELTIKWLHYYPYDYNFFIFKYKKEFCPIHEEHRNDWCIYAHNYQEIRRLDRNNILNKYCSEWNKTKVSNFYNEFCKVKNCNKLHGWKEFFYYYENFKKKECKEKNNCRYLPYCFKNHGTKIEKNYCNLVKNLKSDCFILTPKNNKYF